MLGRLIVAMLMGVAICGGSTTARATEPSQAYAAQEQGSAPDTSVPVAPPLTKADADAWLDGFVPHTLAMTDIAGAVVVVVKDGQVLTEKGYGYADIASRRKVDPQSTLFRIGSVGKLFTWTAVMQQVEAGNIDLDVDINRYLDLKIPARAGQPITLRNLMTHTSGFEEHLKRLFVDSPDRLQSLEAYVKQWVPERAYAPGEVPAYSNYGTALAGYIVQRVSGEPFDDYIERHILGPLGMLHSTFRQPLPAQFQVNMASGYVRASQPPKKFELPNPHPVGSISATGADMARFMIAHLQDGAFEGSRILQAATAQQMHAEQRKHNPPLNAMALGFFHSERNGHVMIGHGGDTEVFHTELQLLPDDQVGIFVSVNSQGADFAHSVRKGLVDGFIDRYFPGAPVDLPTAATAQQHANAMAGFYSPSRRNHSSFFRLANLLGQVKVTASGDGTLQVSSLTDFSGAPMIWRAVGPLVWQTDGGEQLAAVVKDGQVVNFASGGFGAAQVMQRVPGWASASWNKPLLYCMVATLLLAVVLWPISALTRRHYGAACSMASRRATLHSWVRIVALIDLLALASYAFVFSNMMNAYYLDSPIDPWLRLAQFLSLLGLLGAAIAAWNACVVWRDRLAAWWVKAATILLAGACVAFAWFAVTLRLASLSTQF